MILKVQNVLNRNRKLPRVKLNHDPPKKKQKKSNIITRQRKLTNMIKENFTYNDTNPEHLQMALALSKSEQPNTEADDDDVELASSYPSTQTKTIEVRRTLEQFGFKNNKRVTRSAEISKRSKKSKYQFITPILYIRNEEERQNMISSKISTILSQTLIPKYNYEKDEIKIKSPYLLSYINESSEIFHLNYIDHSKLDIDLFYSKELNFEKSDAQCGYLLKDWHQIPGRPKTPPRDVNSEFEHTVKICDENEKVVQENIVVDNSVSILNDGNNKIEENMPRSLSPDLFTSDDESTVEMTNISRKLQSCFDMIDNIKRISVSQALPKVDQFSGENLNSFTEKKNNNKYGNRNVLQPDNCEIIEINDSSTDEMEDLNDRSGKYTKKCVSQNTSNIGATECVGIEKYTEERRRRYNEQIFSSESDSIDTSMDNVRMSIEESVKMLEEEDKNKCNTILSRKKTNVSVANINLQKENTNCNYFEGKINRCNDFLKMCDTTKYISNQISPKNTEQIPFKSTLTQNQIDMTDRFLETLEITLTKPTEPPQTNLEAFSASMLSNFGSIGERDSFDVQKYTSSDSDCNVTFKNLNGIEHFESFCDDELRISRKSNRKKEFYDSNYSAGENELSKNVQLEPFNSIKRNLEENFNRTNYNYSMKSINDNLNESNIRHGMNNVYDLTQSDDDIKEDKGVARVDRERELNHGFGTKSTDISNYLDNVLSRFNPTPNWKSSCGKQDSDYTISKNKNLYAKKYEILSDSDDSEKYTECGKYGNFSDADHFKLSINNNESIELDQSKIDLSYKSAFSRKSLSFSAGCNRESPTIKKSSFFNTQSSLEEYRSPTHTDIYTLVKDQMACIDPDIKGLLEKSIIDHDKPKLTTTKTNLDDRTFKKSLSFTPISKRESPDKMKKYASFTTPSPSYCSHEKPNHTSTNSISSENLDDNGIICISDEEINYSSICSTPYNRKFDDKKITRPNISLNDEVRNEGIADDPNTYSYLEKYYDEQLYPKDNNDSNREFTQTPITHPRILELAHKSTPLPYSKDLIDSENQSSVDDNKPDARTSTPEGYVIVKRKNVTPMPDYENMKTPKLMKELGKIGVKQLKRHRSIQILKHIYETTHPICQNPLNEDDDSDDEKYIPKNIKRRKLTKHKSRRKLEINLRNDESNENDTKVLEASGNGIEGIEIVGDIPESENFIFERHQSKKIPSCPIPLHIAWHNFVSGNPALKQNILLYEPLQLEALYAMLKDRGYRYHIQDLLTFLDKKCITIKTNQHRQGKSRF